jgi:hypothetical protein
MSGSDADRRVQAGPPFCTRSDRVEIGRGEIHRLLGLWCHDDRGDCDICISANDRVQLLATRPDVAPHERAAEAPGNFLPEVDAEKR